MTTNQDPQLIVAQINAAIDEIKANQKIIHGSMDEAVNGATTTAKEAMATAEKAATAVQAAADRIVELEQKLADRVVSGKAAVKTLGQMVLESDSFKNFANGGAGRMKFEANTITGQEGSPAENSDTLVPAQRRAGIVPGAFRTLRVQDALPNIPTSSNAYEYTRELLFTNNAAETAEGAAKPESVLTFELETANVRTVAHFIKASVQILEDAPRLRVYIDNRMRYGVDLRFENQILNGNGTGQNISGITDSGNHTAFTPVSGDTQLDSINRAIYQILGADYPADLIILSHTDWGVIERIKGTDDHYIIGNPQGTIGPVLWGLPVVVTNSLAAGKFIVTAGALAQEVVVRSGTVIEMFTQDEDNAQKNLVTIRGERRGTIAHLRPASVRYGDLTL